MDFVQRLSIRWKLVGMIFFGSAAALIIGYFVILSDQFKHFQEEVERLSALRAVLVAKYCVAPMTFEDYNALEETLKGLATFPDFMATAVYDNNGRLLKSISSPVPGDFFIGKSDSSLNSGFGTGYYLTKSEITFNGIKYGKLYLWVSTDKFSSDITNSLINITILIIGLLLFSLFLANFLQRFVSKPLIELSEFTRHVSESGIYSSRISIEGSDEIAMLGKDLNGLLDKIEDYRNKKEQIEKELENIAFREREKAAELEITLQELKESQNASINLLEDLSNEIEMRKETEKSLALKIKQLERFNHLTTGREIRMIGLKREVNELLERTGKSKKYDVPPKRREM